MVVVKSKNRLDARRFVKKERPKTTTLLLCFSLECVPTLRSYLQPLSLLCARALSPSHKSFRPLSLRPFAHVQCACSCRRVPGGSGRGVMHGGIRVLGSARARRHPRAGPRKAHREPGSQGACARGSSAQRGCSLCAKAACARAMIAQKLLQLQLTVLQLTQQLPEIAAQALPARARLCARAGLS